MTNHASFDGLIENARAGSDEAFEELVRTHQRLVRTFIIRHIGASQTADDLAQEVFVAAYRGIGSFRGDSSVTTWLLAIAKNHVLLHFRSQAQLPEISLDSVLERMQLQALEEHGFDAHAEERRVDALRSCIQSLDAPHRDVLTRFYYRTESAETIATSLGRKSGAIRMLLLRIRKQLRTCIEGKLRAGEMA